MSQMDTRKRQRIRHHTTCVMIDICRVSKLHYQISEQNTDGHTGREFHFFHRHLDYSYYLRREI